VKRLPQSHQRLLRDIARAFVPSHAGKPRQEPDGQPPHAIVTVLHEEVCSLLLASTMRCENLVDGGHQQISGGLRV